MATRMLQRRGTAAEWAAENPVLSSGEMGFETDTKIIKMGDGVTPWNDLGLPYVPTGGGEMTGPLSLVEPTEDDHAVRLLDLGNRIIEARRRITLRFFASASFNKADFPWARVLRLTVQGAGGGGAGAYATGSGQASAGNGGGGGACSFSMLLVEDLPSSSIPVTVGAAGAGGVAGATATNGGSSSFGSLVTAGGGQGTGTFTPRTTSSVGAGATVATAGTADLVIPGSVAGTWCFVNLGPESRGGQGGDSYLGVGGRMVNPNTSGAPGSGYGAGGGGAANLANSTARDGGNGSPGIVIVEVYA